jgi:hypothetical protein
VTDKLTWRSGGVEKTWTVTKQPGESVAQFMARADSEFEAQLSLYPPD